MHLGQWHNRLLEYKAFETNLKLIASKVKESFTNCENFEDWKGCKNMCSSFYFDIGAVYFRYVRNLRDLFITSFIVLHPRGK